MGDASAKPTHYLYHFNYSICSIMARYAYALRGNPKDSKNEIRIEERQVNLGKGEQLTEHYLCDINPAGDVPVLAPVDSEKTLPDSLEITKRFAEAYPALIPEKHSETIASLLEELHGINFFSLTFTNKPGPTEERKAWLQKQLETDISDQYRKAIEGKIKRYDNVKLGGLKGEVVKENEEKAKALMLRFQDMLKDSQTGWLLNLPEPSALDAHLVVFIARMYDVKRHNLIPETLQEYGNRVMAEKAWVDLMQGRNTTGF